MSGRDLKGRTDLLPPPGGFDADRLYYVPSYFTLVKFRHDVQRCAADPFSALTISARFSQIYAGRVPPALSHDPARSSNSRRSDLGFYFQLSVDELPNLWSVLAGDLRT